MSEQTPVLEYPYTTLGAVRQETRNNVVASQNAMIWAINLASRAIDDYCHRDFLYHDFSATPFRIPKSDIIGKSVWMRWPIVSLASISVNGTDVSSDDYYFEPGKFEIEYNSDNELDNWYAIGGSAIDMPNVNWMNSPLPGPDGLPWLKQWKPTPILVTGIFGYPVPDTTRPPTGLPAFIARAATEIAAAWSGEYRREWTSPTGGTSSAFESRIPKEALSIMERYRWQMV